MSGRKSRNKGADFERTIANQLRAWSGNDGFRRTKFSDGPSTRTPDIITPPEFLPVIECKNREGWSWDATLQGKGPVWDWWNQAITQVGPSPGDAWLILTRNRQPVYLVLDDCRAEALNRDHRDLEWLARIPPMGYVYILADVLEATDVVWWCAA